MNANELADYLLNFIMTVEDYDESKHEKAATMLRQQQAEIEALKKEAALQMLSDFTQEDEIEALKEVNTKQVNYISKQKEEYEKLWKEHMELFWKHEQDKELEQDEK